jgi:hypothetical protein
MVSRQFKRGHDVNDRVERLLSGPSRPMNIERATSIVIEPEDFGDLTGPRRFEGVNRDRNLAVDKVVSQQVRSLQYFELGVK